MSDPNNDRHPSSLTDEETQALRDSDPSAFDDDTAEAGEPGAGEGAAAAAGSDPAADEDAAAAAGTAVGKGEPAAAAVAAEAADAGKGGKAPPEAVPKARLDEVIGQRNEAEALARQQAAELAALREQLAKAQPPKDFEAEYEAAQKKYDDGDLDAGEFAKEQRRIQREEFAHISRVAAMETRRETVTQAVQKTWEEEVAAFATSNPGFLEDAKNVDVFQRALNSTVAFYGDTITSAQLLKLASEKAFEHTGYKPAGADADPADKDPAAAADTGAAAVAARRTQNAQRAAEASGAPPQISGGVGERGGPSRGVDLDNLKPGTFSTALSKAEQEKLLGEGAV